MTICEQDFFMGIVAGVAVAIFLLILWAGWYESKG
jgi:hypothetical protein